LKQKYKWQDGGSMMRFPNHWEDRVARGHLASKVEEGSGVDGRPSELVYARVVEAIRDGGLSSSDLARVVGVAERQVRNWSAGGNSPSGRNRDRLLEVHYLTEQLRDVYSREGAEIWMHGRKRSLGARRPIDLLAEGEYEVVLEAIEGLRSGAM
jgi:uncharacterized protein (DUF2384 family)